MDSSNRTFVCSVLFLDLVEYSTRTVAEQHLLKQRFNTLLGRALQKIAPDDRIVLDTGDGAAVTFAGNPEDALFVAMSLREALAGQGADAARATRLAMRFGINLGPVRLIKDLNGQLNIIGDGINAAERIMSFAEPGQILASRSYYEVVAALDEQYPRLFDYQGPRTDKHVREHEVYAVGSRQWPDAAADTPAQEEALPRRRSARWRVGVPVVLGFLLGMAVVLKPAREAPVASAEAAAVPASLPVKKAPLRPEATLRKPAPPEEAVAVFNVFPWGEIVVNGRSRGVTPPLKVLELPPGRHRIEIRNASLKPHATTVDLKPGERITIRHRFGDAPREDARRQQASIRGSE